MAGSDAVVAILREPTPWSRRDSHACVGAGVALIPSSLRQRVVTDPDVKATYAAGRVRRAPRAGDFEVVRARDLADVVEVCVGARDRTPVVPQGARSCLPAARWRSRAASSSTPRRSTRSATIDPLEGLAVAGPGVINADLKDAVAAAGLFYPPDPACSAFCTIGGNVATNAGGLCCVKYGVTADYVRALQVVLPGGEVIRTGHRTAKGVAGLDLTGLFVGSEGTLGRRHARSSTRLVPAPDPALTVLATFDSLEPASRGHRRPAPRAPRALAWSSCSTAPPSRPCRRSPTTASPADCAAALLVQSDRPGHTAEDVAALCRDARPRRGAVEVAVADDVAGGRPAARRPPGAEPGPGGQGPALPRGRLRPGGAAHRPDPGGSGHRRPGAGWRSRCPGTPATATCTPASSSTRSDPASRQQRRGGLRRDGHDGAEVRRHHHRRARGRHPQGEVACPGARRARARAPARGQGPVRPPGVMNPGRVYWS